jgi:ketosteroid isomerase-like protein
MPVDTKELLRKGNAANMEGNYEGFLALCTEDTFWEFIGERTLSGKQAVLDWMKETYLEPPRVTVDDLVSDGDYLVAVGEISMKDKDGAWKSYDYTDIWRFRDGKLAGLRAFVIERTQY